MLTVIVPIYNVECYIREFLNSALKKTNEIEYILIDDGTQDQSIKIAEEYLSQFDNIKIYHKPNGGLSDARNFGLKFVKGDYVFFADSDDILNIDNIIKTYNKAVNLNLDVIYANYVKIDEKSNELEFKKRKNRVKKVVLGNEYLRKTFDGKSLEVSVWRGIYKYDFLYQNQIQFIKGLYHEDLLFTLDVLKYAKSVTYDDSIIYHYRQREGSIMSTLNPNKGKSLIFISREIHTYSCENPSSKIWNIQNKYNVLNVLRNYKMINKQSFWKIIKMKGWTVRLILIMVISLFSYYQAVNVENFEYEKNSIYNK